MQLVLYEVEDYLGHTLATKMTLKTALILISGLIDAHYTDEYHESYIIKRCPKEEETK
jgi:hypothetical protein